MLYDEFVKGTGCRQNDHNYQVYKELEIIYMNTDCCKKHIYEMGKKLVDNSKTEKEIEFENNIKAQIANLKAQLKHFTTEAKRYTELHKEDPSDIFWKDQANWQKELAQQTRRDIAALKWVLNG